jgi:predicted ATPase/DNA-binding SARP family transcriptional activator
VSPVVVKDNKQPQLYLFGSPRLEVDGTRVQIGRRKSMALLAYLAVTDQAHGRTSLATLLWPENGRSCALASLRQALSQVREPLGEPILAIGRESIGLHPETGLWVDVIAFRRCLADALKQDTVASVESLMGAFALYQADFMAAFLLRDAPAFDDWQFLEAESLRQESVLALERVIRFLAQQNRAEEAIPFACRWLELDPFSESAQQELLRLYIRTGQIATAVRHYGLLARRTEQELGMLPVLKLDELLREELLPVNTAGFQQTIPLFSPTARPKRSTLPRILTPFAGRTNEVDELIARLSNRDCALLTLVGPGGSGKTRLAIEATRHLENQFADGAHFVSLIAVDSLDGLMTAIAHALQFSFYGGDDLEVQLAERLQAQEALLILDNFEQLATHAGVLTRLLTAAPGVKLLVTSCCRLNLQEEWLFPLHGLTFPASPDDPASTSYEAVEFFLHCVKRVCPHYVLEAGDLSHIVHICQLVDGLPLGIELAAAWVRTLSCREIAYAIADDAHNLATIWTNMPERHASLGAVCARSWQFLNANEQLIAEQLSLFCGGFDSLAAQAIAGASLPSLMSLTDKSLLRHTLANVQGGGRFQMHEVIRRYARNRLEADEERARMARDRYSHYYTTFLRDRETQLQNNRQLAALSEIAMESSNIQAAWRWAATQGLATAVDRAISPLYLFYDSKGLFGQGIEDFDLALCHWQNQPANSAAPETWRLVDRLLVRQGMLLSRSYDLEKAEANLHKAIARLQQDERNGPHEDEINRGNRQQDDSQVRHELAIALSGLAEIAWQQGKWQEAKERYQESLAYFQALGYKTGVARILTSLGNIAVETAKCDEAWCFYQESRALYQELGNSVGTAGCLNNFSHIAEMRGDYPQAEKWLQESLAMANQASAWWIKAVVLSNLAHIATLQNQCGEAEMYLDKSLALRQQYRLPGLAETQKAMENIQQYREAQPSSSGQR